MNIPLIKPYINDSIKKRVCEVLDSGYLTEGPVTREFENKMKDFSLKKDKRFTTTHFEALLAEMRKHSSNMEELIKKYQKSEIILEDIALGDKNKKEKINHFTESSSSSLKKNK